MSEEQHKPIIISFPDKQTVQRVVDLVVRKKPLGWSRKSFATYYNEHYALQLKRELDLMLENKKSRLIALGQTMKTTSTIYLFVNQAWRYLIENLDPDGRYGTHKNNCRIQRVHGRGVAIWWRETIDEIKGEEISEKKDIKKWKMQVDDYLISDDIKPLHLERLILSVEEVEQLKEELSDLENIVYSVTCKEIKIVKTH